MSQIDFPIESYVIVITSQSSDFPFLLHRLMFALNRLSWSFDVQANKKKYLYSVVLILKMQLRNLEFGSIIKISLALKLLYVKKWHELIQVLTLKAVL